MAVVLEGGDLGAVQTVHLDAGTGFDACRDLSRQRCVAAGVVEQGQPQRHQQQPAQRGAAGGQHQGFPHCRALAAGPPLDQPGPGQGGQRCGQKCQPRKAGLKAGCQLGDVRGRLPGYAGLHGNPDHPDDDGAAGEKQQREPVNQRGHAALEGGQGKGRQGRQRWQAQQQAAVRRGGGHRGGQRHQRKPQRQGHVPAGQLPAPAPQGPGGQRPGGPGEPDQQTCDAAPFLAVGRAFQAGNFNAPTPEIQPPGQGGHRQGQSPGQKHPAPGVDRVVVRPCALRVAQCHQRAAGAQEGRHRGGTAQGQAGQADHQPEGRAHHFPGVAVGAGRHGVKNQRRETELRQGGGGFVRELGQAEAGDQGQQGGIGNRPGVIDRAGFPAKGKRHGLGLRAARQVIDGVPGAQQCQRQQQAERYPRRKSRVEKGQGLDRQGAHPVGCKRFKLADLSQQQRMQPAGVAGGQFAHGAEGRNVGVFPGAATEEAGQDIGHAEQQQRQPGQAANCRLGDDGWRGFVQGRSGWTEGPILGQKKAA